MNQNAVSPLPDDELLARFVLFSRWIRTDGTVKQDAFLPPPDLNLSVTRHAGLSVVELWAQGHRVAEQRRLSLHGRADVSAGRVMAVGLEVIPAALEENLEHAHITGWPEDKSAQKSLAQRIAAAARFHRCS